MSKEIKTFIFGALTAAIILFALNHSCGAEKPSIDPTDTLKQQVKELMVLGDSVKKDIVYRDSIRTIYITKWKPIRHDSLIPCETKLLVCDTILLADSALISEYKTKAMFDSSIISHQASIIANDSVKLSKLAKELKRQKRLKWLFLAGGLVGGVAATR